MNLNETVLQKTIDYMKALPKERFNMNKGLAKLDEDKDAHPCNTVACIVGNVLLANTDLNNRWVELLLPPRSADYPSRGTTTPYELWSAQVKIARELLGLDSKIAKHLFTPEDDYADFSIRDPASLIYVTLARAIEQLEYVKDTGKVNWDPAIVAAHRLLNN